MDIHSSNNSNRRVSGIPQQEASLFNSVSRPALDSDRLDSSKTPKINSFDFKPELSRAPLNSVRLSGIGNTQEPEPVVNLNATFESVKPTPIISALNRDGGISIIGQGIAGLALAIHSKKAGCKVRIIAPQGQVPLYPLLNFRGEHVKDLIEMGVNPALFSPVSGFPKLDISVSNTFAGELQSNIYYGRLVSQLTQICQKLGVKFENKSIEANQIQQIAEKSALIFIASGASPITKEITQELGMQQASDQFLKQIKVFPANQTFISALVQVNDDRDHDGRANIYRSQTTGGAVVALRQTGTMDSNKVWLNIQLPAGETNSKKRVADETRFLFGDHGQIQHTTRPFTVSPKLNIGEAENKDEIGLVPSLLVSVGNQVARSVPVIPAGDATGSSGFRTSAGAGVGLEQSRILASQLRQPLEHDLIEWADDLFLNFVDMTTERLKAEEAVFARDDQYFVPQGTELSAFEISSRLKQYAVLDPIGSSGRRVSGV